MDQPEPQEGCDQACEHIWFESYMPEDDGHCYCIRCGVEDDS